MSTPCWLAQPLSHFGKAFDRIEERASPSRYPARRRDRLGRWTSKQSTLAEARTRLSQIKRRARSHRIQRKILSLKLARTNFRGSKRGPSNTNCLRLETA